MLTHSQIFVYEGADVLMALALYTSYLIISPQFNNSHIISLGTNNVSRYKVNIGITQWTNIGLGCHVKIFTYYN